MRTRSQQEQNYIKEHANYETGVWHESQFNFYNWINRIIKLYNKINLKKTKIEDTEERLRQLKNQEKKILKQDIIKRRKERTHRLITRRPILESLIENAEELTDEEIKILLEEATKTKEFKETLRIIR